MDNYIAALETEYDNQEHEQHLLKISDLVKTDDDASLLETIRGLTESTEGFREALMSRVSSLRSSVWDNFMSGMDSSRAQAENRLGRLRFITKVADDIKYDGGRGMVSTASGYSQLEVGGKIVTGREFVDALRQLSTIVNNELHDEMDFLLATTDRITGDMSVIIGQLDGTITIPEVTRRLGRIGELGDMLIRRRNSLPYLTPDGTHDGKVRYASSNLLGNVKLTSVGGSYNSPNIKATGLQQQRAISAVFEMRTTLAHVISDYTAPAEISQLSERDLYDAIKYMDKILSDIIRFRIRYGNRFAKEKKRFTTYRDRLNNLGKKHDNVEHLVYLRKTADVANSISRWIHTPALPLIGHSLKVVSAGMTYVAACTALNRNALNVK